MKTKLEKGLRYLAAGIFFTALMLNVKFTLDSPYFLTGNELVAQTTGTDTSSGGFSSWWDSKVYKCVPETDCMRDVQFAMNAGGTWGQAGGSFNFSITYVSLPGKREKCRDGNEVAHCWNCNTECVVPIETITKYLESVNKK